MKGRHTVDLTVGERCLQGTSGHSCSGRIVVAVVVVSSSICTMFLIREVSV